MTDSALGNPESWLEAHGDYLFGYAVRRLRDRETAEDVVQETFLAALSARDSFAGRSSVRTWLIGILKNKIVDHIRKQSREKPFTEFESDDPSLRELFTSDGTWLRESAETKPMPWRSDPEKLARNKEFLAILDDCLEGIPDRLAKAFMLKEIDDLSGKEVCQVLGINTTNLWVMLHRARMRLRRCLEINWFESERTDGLGGKGGRR